MLNGIERAPYWLTEVIRNGRSSDVDDENFAWWVLTAFRVNHFHDVDVRRQSFEFAMRLTKDQNETVKNVDHVLRHVLREAERIASWIEAGSPPDEST